MEDEVQIINLIRKYIENQCTEAELQQLLGWLKSPCQQNSFADITAQVWDKLNKDIDISPLQQREELSKEALLLLDKIKVNQLVPQIKKKKINRWVIRRIAAILLLILSITSGIYYLKNVADKQLTYVEEFAQRGERRVVTLPDGSRITLNSESKLRYADNFNQDSRTIEMTGEAFFEVASNARKPFVIRSGETCIKVLGTSFNINAYDKDELMAVTVSTGKVNVIMDKQELQLNLTSNEHLLVNKVTGSFEKKIIDENNYIKWMDGTLFFEKEPIREVVKELNRKYNRRVVLQAGVRNYVISGTHDNKSLEAVVEAICYTTGLSYRAEGQDIVIYEIKNKLNHKNK